MFKKDTTQHNITSWLLPTSSIEGSSTEGNSTLDLSNEGSSIEGAEFPCKPLVPARSADVFDETITEKEPAVEKSSDVEKTLDKTSTADEQTGEESAAKKKEPSVKVPSV